MTTITNIPTPFPSHLKGSKFRPVDWHDIYKQTGRALLGYGIEEKPKGARRYIPRGWNMQIHPFATKKDAQAVCDQLNAAAKED